MVDLPKPEELSCSFKSKRDDCTGRRRHLEVGRINKTCSIDTCTFAYCHALLLLLFEEGSEEENERRRARIKIKLRVLMFHFLFAHGRPCMLVVGGLVHARAPFLYPEKGGKHFKKVGIF